MTLTEKNIVVIKEIVVENSFKALLYDNGIIEIIWDNSVEMIEEIHLIQLREVIFNLGGGRKMPLFYSIPEFLHISDNAKEFAASEYGGRYTLANAVLIKNIAQKLVFNFFMTVNKPKSLTKGFSNRKDAFMWLENLRQTQ